MWDYRQELQEEIDDIIDGNRQPPVPHVLMEFVTLLDEASKIEHLPCGIIHITGGSVIAAWRKTSNTVMVICSPTKRPQLLFGSMQSPLHSSPPERATPESIVSQLKWADLIS